MKRNLINLLAVILVITMLIGTFTVYAVDDVDSAKSEMPYTEPSGTFGDLYAGTVSDYSASEAAEAGIPSGYIGSVLRVAPGTDGAYAGCEFDFSSQNISTDDIESITFRVNLPVGHSEMRLLGEGAGSWVMRAVPSVLGAWCDVTLTADGENFMSEMSMATLANSEGNLGKICLVGRMGNAADKCYYLDSITVTYKSGSVDDTTPPVITYSGETELNYLAGDVFNFDGISAYDEFDGASARISAQWSDGACALDGTLNVGTHTVKVIATDRSGNQSSITLTVNAKSDPSVINLDTIPYTDYLEGVSIYDGNVVSLTSEEAATAGVPAGYTGNVLKVSGNTNRYGMTFDPGELNIPTDLIEKMTVRILLYETTNAFRISNDGGQNWNVLKAATSGAWTEFTMLADGAGFSMGNFTDLGDSDGNLGAFGIATNDKTGNLVFYIDSIVITLKKDDGKAPVMNYNGSTDIITSAEKPFVLDISAYDELSQKYLDLEYDFSDGAVDAVGYLKEGEHTCRISATNYYGHTSYLDFNLTVGPKDTEAPVIDFGAENVYAQAGSILCLNVLGIDNYDSVVVEERWSKTPTDIGGRLIKGEYTLTLIVTDLTGNISSKTVYLHVTEADIDVGQLIVCPSSKNAQ